MARAGAGSAPAMSRGESLESVLQTEIIPRLMLAHRAGPVPPSVAAAVGRELSDEQVEEFVRLVRAPTEGGIDQFVRDLVDRGVTAEAVYLDLLGPAARRLGTLWDTDACDFMEVTLAMGRIQRVLRSMSRLLLGDADPTPRKGAVLLSALPGEQHTLGLFMVAEFFVREGWAVNVGAPLSALDLRQMLADQWFDVLGFSLSCDSHLLQVGKEVRAARKASRNRKLRVLVGGRLFVERPELVEAVGADASATDAREAPQVAAVLIGSGAA